MLLPPDFREFVELMIDPHVRFVMIGGGCLQSLTQPEIDR